MNAVRVHTVLGLAYSKRWSGRANERLPSHVENSDACYDRGGFFWHIFVSE